MHKIDKSQHEKEELERLLKEKEEDVLPRSHEEKVANRPPPDLPHHHQNAAVKEVA